MGPSIYGNFHFITYSYTEITGFISAGTPSAFFNKLSKRQNEINLVKFYSLVMVAIILLLISITSSIFYFNWNSKIWVGIENKYIWMGCFWASLVFITNIFQNMLDAFGLTVKGETYKVLQRIISLFFILSLYLTKSLTIYNFFIYHYLILMILMCFWWTILRKKLYLNKKTKLSVLKIKNYLNEFYIYSMPLLAYSFFSLLSGFFDRWALQSFHGSTEQGFYSISYQISAMCILFATSMTPLFQREMAIEHKNLNLKKMKALFLNTVPLFFTITSFLVIFIIFQSDNIIFLLGGDEFSAAIIPMSIMMLYPAHQTLGQLCGSIFLATEQTKLYRNIGILSMILGLITTYFFLAPKEIYGLNMGSTGLALKMVLVQFITVNVFLWFNSKMLKISFLQLFFSQIVILFFFISLAQVSNYIASLLIFNKIINFIFSGLIYSLFSGIFVFSFPSLLFISRKKLISHFEFLLNFFKNDKSKQKL